MKLNPPVAPAYDYKSLAYFLSVWQGVESSAPWMGAGYSHCSPIHRMAVTSRQWDTEGEVMDDSLEKSTAERLGQCLENLDAVDRTLITYAHCGIPSKWVEAMEPQRAQERYEGAMHKLAIKARLEGVDV